MAIMVEQQNRGVSWLLISGIISVFLLLIISTYYLFFSPTPFIETIIPAEIQKTSQISEITLDRESIGAVVNHPVADKLRKLVPPPDFGSFGRRNPFLFINFFE